MPRSDGTVEELPVYDEVQLHAKLSRSGSDAESRPSSISCTRVVLRPARRRLVYDIAPGSALFDSCEIPRRVVKRFELAAVVVLGPARACRGLTIRLVQQRYMCCGSGSFRGDRVRPRSGFSHMIVANARLSSNRRRAIHGSSVNRAMQQILGVPERSREPHDITSMVPQWLGQQVRPRVACLRFRRRYASELLQRANVPRERELSRRASAVCARRADGVHVTPRCADTPTRAGPLANDVVRRRIRKRKVDAWRVSYTGPGAACGSSCGGK